jgi:hypothetical protein
MINHECVEETRDEVNLTHPLIRFHHRHDKPRRRGTAGIPSALVYLC